MLSKKLTNQNGTIKMNIREVKCQAQTNAYFNDRMHNIIRNTNDECINASNETFRSVK